MLPLPHGRRAGLLPCVEILDAEELGISPAIVNTRKIRATGWVGTQTPIPKEKRPQSHVNEEEVLLRASLSCQVS
jgi:hypothetical protein